MENPVGPAQRQEMSANYKKWQEKVHPPRVYSLSCATFLRPLCGGREEPTNWPDFLPFLRGARQTRTVNEDELAWFWTSDLVAGGL